MVHITDNIQWPLDIQTMHGTHITHVCMVHEKSSTATSIPRDKRKLVRFRVSAGTDATSTSHTYKHVLPASQSGPEVMYQLPTVLDVHRWYITSSPDCGTAHAVLAQHCTCIADCTCSTRAALYSSTYCTCSTWRSTAHAARSVYAALCCSHTFPPASSPFPLPPPR
jgi:hypothetical protein